MNKIVIAVGLAVVVGAVALYVPSTQAQGGSGGGPPFAQGEANFVSLEWYCDARTYQSYHFLRMLGHSLGAGSSNVYITQTSRTDGTFDPDWCSAAVPAAVSVAEATGCFANVNYVQAVPGNYSRGNARIFCMDSRNELIEDIRSLAEFDMTADPEEQ